MKSTEVLPEKTDAVNEALEVGTHSLHGISLCCDEATRVYNEECNALRRQMHLLPQSFSMSLAFSFVA